MLTRAHIYIYARAFVFTHTTHTHTTLHELNYTRVCTHTHTHASMCLKNHANNFNWIIVPQTKKLGEGLVYTIQGILVNFLRHDGIVLKQESVLVLRRNRLRYLEIMCQHVGDLLSNDLREREGK